MTLAAPLSVVTEAVRSGTTGCVVWKDGADTRVRRDAALQGLTPEGIIDILIEFVRDLGGLIAQRRETRPYWRGFQDYVYEVLIPVSGLPRDLYVELVLSDPVDEECPVAVIVSAHLTSF